MRVHSFAALLTVAVMAMVWAGWRVAPQRAGKPFLPQESWRPRPKQGRLRYHYAVARSARKAGYGYYGHGHGYGYGYGKSASKLIYGQKPGPALSKPQDASQPRPCGRRCSVAGAEPGGMRAQALPDGVELLLRILAGDPDAWQKARAMSGLREADLIAAAELYVLQVMLHQGPRHVGFSACRLTRIAAAQGLALFSCLRNANLAASRHPMN